jgi:hypothetical protein
MKRNEIIHVFVAWFLFFAFWFGFLFYNLAAMPSNSQQALDKSKDAILAYPSVRTWRGNGEREMYRQLKFVGIGKNQVTAAAVGYSLFQGEFSTKPFKNLRYRKDNFEVRPEAKYMFYRKEGNGMLTLSWSW